MFKKAISLIEIVFVIIIIAIASIGLVVSISQVLFDMHKPQIIATAIALSSGEAERVIRLGFSNVLDQNRDSPASFSGNFSAYSWQVRVDSIDTVQPNLGSDPAMAKYKCVQVRVHHPVINYISVKFLKTNSAS